MQFLIGCQCKPLEGQMRIFLPDTWIPELYLFVRVDVNSTLGLDGAIDEDYLEGLLGRGVGGFSMHEVWDVPDVVQ